MDPPLVAAPAHNSFSPESPKPTNCRYLLVLISCLIKTIFPQSSLFVTSRNSHVTLLTNLSQFPRIVTPVTPPRQSSILELIKSQTSLVMYFQHLSIQIPVCPLVLRSCLNSELLSIIVPLLFSCSDYCINNFVQEHCYVSCYV